MDPRVAVVSYDATTGQLMFTPLNAASTEWFTEMRVAMEIVTAYETILQANPRIRRDPLPHERVSAGWAYPVLIAKALQEHLRDRFPAERIFISRKGGLGDPPPPRGR